ncbi:MAG: dTDP-4-dehydrorhamnose 3,5-epimerase [Steroidobacteraceae bacterium]
MRFTPTTLAEVILIEPQVFSDFRGAFLEFWEARKFAAAGIAARFVQDNHSISRRWVLRGLHYQRPSEQGKLVRVIVGEVYDVAVDMRRSSPTFGRSVGVQLTAGNYRMLWVPPGFAHGFLALSDAAEVIYKCTDYYSKADERVIAWNDPAIGIAWPLPPGVQPLLADRDRDAPPLGAVEGFP